MLIPKDSVSSRLFSFGYCSWWREKSFVFTILCGTNYHVPVHACRERHSTLQMVRSARSLARSLDWTLKVTQYVKATIPVPFPTKRITTTATISFFYYKSARVKDLLPSVLLRFTLLLTTESIMMMFFLPFRCCLLLLCSFDSWTCGSVLSEPLAKLVWYFNILWSLI